MMRLPLRGLALLVLLWLSLTIASDAPYRYGAYLALLPEIQPPWN